MRWESKVKYAELAPAHNWRFKDSGNFGGRSLLTPDQDTLAHYGVPGMRWGVKTKEYVKKGYDTLKRRQAILKMKRKAEAKAQYDEGYHRGQRVASNTYFIKSKVAEIISKKEARNKQRFSDRVVDKATDFALKKSGLDKMAKAYGLDAHIGTAKKFLKDKKDESIDNILESLKDEENQKRVQDALNRILTGKVVRSGVEIARSVGSAVRRNAPEIRRTIRRSAALAGKVAGRKVLTAAKVGSKWLREGGAKKIRSAVGTAGNAVLRGTYFTANQLNRTAEYAHRQARRGHKALRRMLSERPRR